MCEVTSARDFSDFQRSQVHDVPSIALVEEGPIQVAMCLNPELRSPDEQRALTSDGVDPVSVRRPRPEAALEQVRVEIGHNTPGAARQDPDWLVQVVTQ